MTDFFDEELIWKIHQGKNGEKVLSQGSLLSSCIVPRMAKGLRWA
jgi:hypothetical protein